MNSPLRFLMATAAGAALMAPASAQTTVTLLPSKDTTLYQNASGSVANGGGTRILIGRISGGGGTGGNTGGNTGGGTGGGT
ncbi:MAG: hypothetical protein VYD05_05865, partial [Planctomycetota bacterium]|nr:hypothetical protein [Planctomycetota bacterium]